MIWFLGDVHGRFDHVIRLVKLHRPEAVVFLGDLECSLPLDMIIRPILVTATMTAIVQPIGITCMAAASLNAACMAGYG
ncbi:hypothetical protein D3C75_1005080 [compost metagenome]